MKVKIKGYGILHDRVGKDRIAEISQGSRLKDLLKYLDLFDASIWIVRVNGSEFALDEELKDGDLVEIVPPIAGG